ncbi:hypothetical protein FB451DRAFT_1184883 [Mycena latifolia]|nr:hypothetical protein FB451DRAFT_1184883 [Mycena latifolia]
MRRVTVAPGSIVNNLFCGGYKGNIPWSSMPIWLHFIPHCCLRGSFPSSFTGQAHRSYPETVNEFKLTMTMSLMGMPSTGVSFDALSHREPEDSFTLAPRLEYTSSSCGTQSLAASRSAHALEHVPFRDNMFADLKRGRWKYAPRALASKLRRRLSKPDAYGTELDLYNGPGTHSDMSDLGLGGAYAPRRSPIELRHIFTSADIAKIGVGIASDATHWEENFVNMSLEQAASEALGLIIDKAYQKSDWKKEPNEARKLYAALNAAIALQIYEKVAADFAAQEATTGCKVAPTWYTFNATLGEPMRTMLACHKIEIQWSSRDCTSKGGTFEGWQRQQRDHREIF